MNQQASEFVRAELSALERAVGEHHGDLRNAQLATVSPQGRPAVRTIVLRSFRRSPACTEFYADSRSRKTTDIAHCAEVELLAWSSSEKTQIRLAGAAQVHRGDRLARDRWEALPNAARRAYGLCDEPGTPIEDPATLQHLDPDRQFERFAVVVVPLSNLEVLRLGPDNAQTRAAGRFETPDVIGHWISP